jgi:hypothetical protein
MPEFMLRVIVYILILFMIARMVNQAAHLQGIPGSLMLKCTDAEGATDETKPAFEKADKFHAHQMSICIALPLSLVAYYLTHSSVYSSYNQPPKTPPPNYAA